MPELHFGAQHGFQQAGPGVWERTDGALRTFFFVDDAKVDCVVTHSGHTTRWTHWEAGQPASVSLTPGSPRSACYETPLPEVSPCANCGVPCLGAVECGPACAALLRNDNVFP